MMSNNTPPKKHEMAMVLSPDNALVAQSVTGRVPTVSDPMDHDLTTDQQQGLILSIFEDLASDPDDFLLYLEHVGLDLRAIRHIRDLSNLILGHYRISRGKYDVHRAAEDLRWWPPIAREIQRLMLKKQRLAK